jgi:hypothetical protein
VAEDGSAVAGERLAELDVVAQGLVAAREQLAKPLSALLERLGPHVRRKTISCCRSTAISDSSRAFDLNGETKMARTNQRSAITRSTLPDSLSSME